jgi:dihydrofolate synthase/folylpolyglutamate synthase
MTSALAFHYFRKAKVDVAVIEVGMGGRLDSTNVINPVLSVITNIGFDHTEFLGDTLAKIATEKAGIIKKETPVVIGQYNPETWEVFSEFGNRFLSPVFLAEKRYTANYSLFTNDYKQVFQITHDSKTEYPNLILDLAGFYQRKNSCTVLTAVDELRNRGFRISNDHVYHALSQVTTLTGLQGRWQILGNNPLIVCDTGHNKEGMTWLIEQIKAVPYRHLHMVIGFVNDKDISGILKMLPSSATYYFTNASIPRALEANQLAGMAAGFGLNGSSFSSVKQAFDTAKASAGADDFIFVGGSTFVVGEIL